MPYTNEAVKKLIQRAEVSRKQEKWFEAAVFYSNAAFLVGEDLRNGRVAPGDAEEAVEIAKKMAFSSREMGDKLAFEATEAAAAPAPTPSAVGAGAKKGANLPDQLPATLKEPERPNPPIEPFNSFLNQQKGIYKPHMSFDDLVVVPEDLKEKVEDALIGRILYPGIYLKELRTRGFIWYGVPGTGKTTLAKAAITELGYQKHYRDPREAQKQFGQANKSLTDASGRSFLKRYFDGNPKIVPSYMFFEIKASDITSLYVGESERNMKRFFEMAGACAPSILFFDEGEVLLDASNEHMQGAIAEFKQQLGGFVEKDITVILNTNYPDKLESAVYSRLPGQFEIPLPGRAARRAIIEKTWKKLKAAATTQQKDVDAMNGLVDVLVDFCRPPNSLGYEYTTDELALIPENVKPDPKAWRSLWSGRDIEELAKTVVLSAARRFQRGRAGEYYIECAPGSPDYADLCKAYRSGLTEDAASAFEGKSILVRVPEGYPGGKPVSALPLDKRSNLVKPPIMRSDITEALRTVKSTVKYEDVFSQMMFNQKVRSMLGTDPTSIRYQEMMRFVLKKDTKGKNTTVPSD